MILNRRLPNDLGHLKQREPILSQFSTKFLPTLLQLFAKFLQQLLVDYFGEIRLGASPLGGIVNFLAHQMDFIFTGLLARLLQ